MRIEYDPVADAMYIRLREGQVTDSDEIRDGVVLDYGVDGAVLGIELLSASRRTDNPREIDFTLQGKA